MRRIALGLLALTLSSGPAWADTAELSPVKDNTLYESTAGDVSNGAGSHFFVGQTLQPADNLRRGLLQFDVSSIPAGSTINSVTLRVNMSMTIVGNVDCALHEVQTEWGEAGSDAPGGEGGGALAQAGDATWINSMFGSADWATPGGDFDPAASAVASVGSATGPYAWDSTPALVADVEGWLADPATNFGWIVIGDETTVSAKRFDTRDNSDPANRPVLTVDFTPPGGGDPEFGRGDCNSDATFNIADAVAGLGILFAGDPAPTCVDACDANDDGAFDIGDMIYILANLFSGGAAIPAPAPGTCGVDPTADGLDCASFSPCP